MLEDKIVQQALSEVLNQIYGVDFLGFSYGFRPVRRKTKSKKTRGKLKELKTELRRRLHQPVPVQGKWLRSAYRGFVNYFAVPGNMPTLKSFHHQLCRIWLKALRRRSQKGKRLTWEKFEGIYPEWLPQPRCKHPNNPVHPVK